MTFDGHQVTNGAMAPLAACRLQSLRSDWCVLGEEGGVCVGGGALRDEIQQHLPTITDTDRSQPPLPHRFAAASRAGFFDVDVDVGGLQLFDALPTASCGAQPRARCTSAARMRLCDFGMRGMPLMLGFTVYIFCVPLPFVTW